jgi:hypothetical protein
VHGVEGAGELAVVARVEVAQEVGAGQVGVVPQQLLHLGLGLLVALAAQVVVQVQHALLEEHGEQGVQKLVCWWLES